MVVPWCPRISVTTVVMRDDHEYAPEGVVVGVVVVVVAS